MMVNRVRNFTSVLCLVTGVFSAWGAAQDSVSGQAAAFKLIEDAVAKGEIPGAVALVARWGKIVREEAYGLSDIENRVPFRTDTVCWIASVTKPVTTAAIVKLVERGKLRLDDPVEKYIPEFQTQRDKQGRHHPITIRQLLTHTAGLPGDPPTRKDVFDPEWRGKSVAETVGPIAQATLQFAPGTKVQYSNAGFYVLGRIIEIVSSRPYADYVKETILDPLGMKESFYPRFLSAVEPQRIASVYRQRQGTRFLYFRYEQGMTTRNDTPDGGLFCTARDIFKFCQMFIDNDGRVLVKDSVEQMLREQAPGRGLGWATENGGFSHAGSSGAYAWGDPNTGLVAVLLIQYNDFRRIPRLHTDFVEAVRTAGTAEQKSQGVSLFGPEDGGTPRAAALVGEFTSPSGKTISVEGSYDGSDTWRLRFTPGEEGERRYLLRGEGVELLARGRLKCVAAQGHAFIRVHPDNPYAFAYADGTDGGTVRGGAKQTLGAPFDGDAVLQIKHVGWGLPHRDLSGGASPTLQLGGHAVAASAGTQASPQVGKHDSYVTSLRNHSIPVLGDEFGYEETDITRSKVWAVFCGGAAGVGTGHHLKAFQRFPAQSRVPFQRMGRT